MHVNIQYQINYFYRFFDIPKDILPLIVKSSEIYFSLHISSKLEIKICKENKFYYGKREYSGSDKMNEHLCSSDNNSSDICIPISGCLGDQQAALVGQRCIKPGTAKNTYLYSTKLYRYGTGCFLLFNAGPIPPISTNGLIATVAYHFDDKPIYALEVYSYI